MLCPLASQSPKPGGPPWNATVLGDDWPEEVARLRNELDGGSSSMEAAASRTH
jgi:hypothetical protein